MTIDPEDPSYQLESTIFNAVTRHPDIKFYFSTRKKLTDKVVAFLWLEVARENALIAERQRDHMREIE